MYPMPFPNQHTSSLPYGDMELEQATSGFLGAFRHIGGYQNIALRTGTRLKSWHCTTYVTSFVIPGTRVVISLDSTLSRKAKIEVTLLIVVASNERIMSVLKTYPFPD
ncbi:hypothetical protein TNCV_4927541 [Trichonephila clavipes]|nr:hypothetical protein TNCV_4927541 [Trichonephila clavipes]